MENTLYPLVYKPGIKRDGTSFQADFCTEGQWIRFQRGNVKKMGSMKGMSHSAVNGKLSTSNLTVIPETGNNSYMNIYIANSENGIHKVRCNQSLNETAVTTIYPHTSPSTIWKSEVIIQNNNKHIVYVGSPNLSNINSSVESLLIAGTIDGTLNPLAQQPSNRKGISGLLYTSSYLFIYGSDGLVQWSKLKNPLDFSNSQDRNITISNDQVVDAKSVRGGTNSPTILFWTLSSVVRCINTPDSGGNLQFQIDVMSRSSSILSTRCVVEYDGMFFWPGTNRFFQYNGIVQELANTMSLNYFYNNLDMDRRQQVVGVKHTQYGEIWWHFPEKMNAPLRDPNIPAGQNSRAIIYNIRENAWYDTAISRCAATYSEDFGFMLTYGLPLSDPRTINASTFRHEFEYLTPNPMLITEQFSKDDSEQLTVAPISSTFTTPVFSWSAFNPMKQLTGKDRWMYLVTVEPDFILVSQDNPDLQMIINTKQYAQNRVYSSTPFNIPPPETENPLSGKIDTAFQGRHMTLTFTSTISNFEMGHIMLSLGIGDGK